MYNVRYEKTDIPDLDNKREIENNYGNYENYGNP